MEEGIPYVATLNHHICYCMNEPIIKNVTGFLRRNPQGTTLGNLIEHMLEEDENFTAGEGTISRLVKEDMKSAHARIVVNDVNIIRNRLREGVLSVIEKHQQDPSLLQLLDNTIDYCLGPENFVIKLRDNKGDLRPIYQELVKAEDVIGNGFLLETALAVPLFERYKMGGSHYMWLNLVFTPL